MSKLKTKSRQDILPMPGASYCVPMNSNDVDNLVGRILTIVDASFADKEQREAFKSIMRSTIYDWMDRHYSYSPTFDWSYDISTNELKISNIHQGFTMINTRVR